MKFKTKLVSTYIMAGLVPVAILGAVAWGVASSGLDTVGGQGASSLETTAQDQFISLREAKQTQIEQYFADRERDMGVLVETVNTLRDEASVFGAMADMVDSIKIKAEAATAIAEGDLTRDIVSASDDDLLGEALGRMSGDLNDILTQVLDASVQVRSGSAQISDASQSLSQGATESAASLEEINSSMVEIGSQTKMNADNAKRASELATNARAAAKTGSDRMETMVAAMGEIWESSTEITKTIDDIAFQTNLLALNAAVEAARAGRHGKGFAVVSEEVRNLAGRSAKAARETAELIESSNARIENGAKVANGTFDALGEIVTGISKTADLVSDIAVASDEQAQGIAQVSQGLHQIDTVVQGSTANSEELAASAVELSAQAKGLQGLLSRFRLKGAPGGGAEGLGQVLLPVPPTAPSLCEPESAWGQALPVSGRRWERGA